MVFIQKYFSMSKRELSKSITFQTIKAQIFLVILLLRKRFGWYSFFCERGLYNKD